MNTEILLRPRLSPYYLGLTKYSSTALADSISSLTTHQTSMTTQVIQRDQLLPSIHEALQTLGEIATLEDNWDGYGAIPLSKRVLDEAEGFIRKLNILQQDIDFVSPGPNGNILVEIRKGGRSIGFHFSPNKPLRYICFNGRDFYKQDIYKAPVIHELIRWLYTDTD